MPLPEVIVRRGDRGAAPIPADDVSTRFEVVVCDHGPIDEPIECRSFTQVRQTVGDHTATSTLRAVESFFAEGGSRVVLSRAVGADARPARLALKNGTVDVLTVEAAGPGTFYHGVRVAVGTADSNRAQSITLTLNGSPLVSGTVADAAEAAELINLSGHAKAVVLRTDSWPLSPVTSGGELAGGVDDAGVEPDDVRRALRAFDEDLGPGSVCASGWDDSAVFGHLADHAAATNRFARGDFGLTTPVETMTSTAALLRRHQNARYLQLFAGWLNISIAGVTLSVPPSGVHTGREALADRENSAGPGQPASWTFGEYRTPTGVANLFTRGEREQLNNAGVTVVVQDSQGAIYAEDAITLVDPTRYPQYAEVSAMRVTMAIHAAAKQALRKRVMQTIDGKGHLAAITTGDIVSVCANWYTRGALFGETPDDAYSASVTAETEPGRRPRLVGYLALRPSPSAHTVELTITQVAPSDTI
ncbi:hypothetical protein Q5424_09400 [Conexibacter sp. JD483]|uniref:hypothetical protein n=1 Tax=unclassified Conexibacter TaxID=2627773 RepID=UPI00272435B8|nr:MULTISPECIES: hypothetical protein [unclassified Conexibacter]MDO8187208.1 hypothetical protein [Conexibacter sp. CPCC 205706]MDO8199305.1 hypothetical protein [Conexibacter sp. CPCC 205762]MDR9369294.1 hypothetical protein [Conexibacter sp. JD483]